MQVVLVLMLSLLNVTPDFCRMISALADLNLARTRYYQSVDIGQRERQREIRKTENVNAAGQAAGTDHNSDDESSP